MIQTVLAVAMTGETLLEEAVELASAAGLVRPHDHIVVVQMVANSFVVKIITVDGDGDSIQPIRPQSLMDMIKVSAEQHITQSLLPGMQSCKPLMVPTDR